MSDMRTWLCLGQGTCPINESGTVRSASPPANPPNRGTLGEPARDRGDHGSPIGRSWIRDADRDRRRATPPQRRVDPDEPASVRPGLSSARRLLPPAGVSIPPARSVRRRALLIRSARFPRRRPAHHAGDGDRGDGETAPSRGGGLRPGRPPRRAAPDTARPRAPDHDHTERCVTIVTGGAVADPSTSPTRRDPPFGRRRSALGIRAGVPTGGAGSAAQVGACRRAGHGASRRAVNPSDRRRRGRTTSPAA